MSRRRGSNGINPADAAGRSKIVLPLMVFRFPAVEMIAHGGVARVVMDREYEMH